MKTVYMIGGTMGIGKTTVCQYMKNQLKNSVFLDGDWCWDAHPFQITNETKTMVMHNICFLLNQFIHCSAYENIIFCWVMHVIPLGGFMKESLYLHIPAYEELWYRQKIMQDPDTMSYNKGYDLNFNDYDKATGCIDFPKKKWVDWYNYFIEQEPHRFYAYIVRESDGEFIGEVNVHRNLDAGWYEMGIVLEAKYRGKGYAVAALRLLLQYAFEKIGVEAVHNEFEEERSIALQTHLSAGFTRYRQENRIIELLITKEQYFRQKSSIA